MGQATAFQRLVTARVKLLFEDQALGSRITLLIPVEVESLGAFATDGTHLMFDPVYIRTAVRADVHARLKEIAAGLPDPVVAPREAFAPWTGRLVDGVLRVDQPSEETLHALDRLDVFRARAARWNGERPFDQSTVAPAPSSGGHPAAERSGGLTVDQRPPQVPLDRVESGAHPTVLTADHSYSYSKEYAEHPKMRTIEIDFDVHKLIEVERRGFDEAPIVALRRLLGLPEAVEPPATAAPQASGGWHGEGVHLPNGTKLRMSYSGRTHDAAINGGRWFAEGKTFDSPSGAASGVALTKAGKRTRLDGWGYWEAKLPGEKEWVRIGSMRAQATGLTGLDDLNL